MKPSRIITLLTDFGTKDPYVGAMKGVILRINPNAVVVDISHEIAPQDVTEAAFKMLGYIPFFPRGTIHVCVVDPGVGSKRRAVAVQTSDSYLVGPDNGVFTLASKKFGCERAVALENKKYFSAEVSRTFHGRDIFAPVAAHLSRQVRLEAFGRKIGNLRFLRWPEPKIARGQLKGEIIHFDRFENAITNIDEKTLKGFLGRANPLVSVKGIEIRELASSYERKGINGPCAIIDSYGFLEVAVFLGKARELFGLKLGDAVLVRKIR